MNESLYPQLNDGDWLYQRAELEGLNAVQIAKIIGCHREAVMRAFKRFGIAPKPRGSRSPFWQLKDPDLLRTKAEQKEATVEGMAKEIGCAPSGVVSALRRFCIPMPELDRQRQRAKRSESVKRALREKYGPEGRKGSRAGNWRGGVRVAPNGYVWLHREIVTQRWPNHPRLAIPDWSHKQEHILVMEDRLGRLLFPGEEVDHVNRDKHDNRPENLELKQSRSEAQRDEWAKFTKLAAKYRQMLIDAGIDPDKDEAA